jgi:hypothetical protein
LVPAEDRLTAMATNGPEGAVDDLGRLLANRRDALDGYSLATLLDTGGGELKIIAAILERPVIEKVLTHLGLDPQPPPRALAREPARHQAG